MTSQLKYLDFDLHIWKDGDRYMAEVRNSPAGATDAVKLRWPFGLDAHEFLMLKLENAILKGRGYRHGPLSSEESVLREFGGDVFRAVFIDSNDIAERFAASLRIAQEKADRVQGLRLRLRVEPPELAMLPWEYMFDESARDRDGLQNFLCLRNLSPLVRFIDAAAPLLHKGLQGPLRILGMIANPGGDWEMLDTEAERDRIAEALKSIPKSQVQLEWVRGGSWDNLFDIVRRREHHIFHFIGHGGTDAYIDVDGQTRRAGFVVMHDGLGGAAKVSASRLGIVLGESSLRLAVLNCCDSGRGGNSLSSTGAALVNAGVPLTVAMQFAISDGAAARFAGMFYKSLVSGEPVERALTDARRFMSYESALEWGIPVLFARSGANVQFEVKLAEAKPIGVRPGYVQLDAAFVESTSSPATSASPSTQAAREALRKLFAKNQLSSTE